MRKVLLVGPGNIGRDYAKVLRGLNVAFDVIGRSEEKCRLFYRDTGVTAHPGGVERYDGELHDYDAAIIAVSASQLSSVACSLMKCGISNILVEKPGGLNRTDFESILQVKNLTGSNVYIGYNRRFYASLRRAEKIIQADGGVNSFHFEFTEWPHTVLAAGLPEESIRSWLLCNSTHVIDMSFFLGGFPEELVSFTSGCAPWTDEKTCFAGAGVTRTGALFDYCADWEGPGRWGVEMVTKRHHLIFRPLEKLQIQQLKSIKIEMADNLDDRLDMEYKPGLFGEVSAFLGFAKEDIWRLKTIEQQLEMLPIFEKISGRRYA